MFVHLTTVRAPSQGKAEAGAAAGKGGRKGGASEISSNDHWHQSVPSLTRKRETGRSDGRNGVNAPNLPIDEGRKEAKNIEGGGPSLAARTSFRLEYPLLRVCVCVCVYSECFIRDIINFCPCPLILSEFSIGMSFICPLFSWKFC